MNGMDPDNPPPPPELRFLKLLVTVLTGVMIVGLVTIVALLVIRLGLSSAPVLPELPDGIVLPAGVTMQALTIARDWVVVVSESGEVLLYDRRSGDLRQRVGVE